MSYFPQFNEYQTPLTDDLINSLPQEVQDQLMDYLTNVEYIKRLVSPTREYAKDRPRDDKGRIIVDLANPHILEDMDYFRPAAIHFEKHGCFTFLKPNSNPNSEYNKWLREETRRCLEGYVRESDGEWVTGLCYFYLNYCPIMLNEMVSGSNSIAVRKEGFPKVWEGIYLRYHYLDQARYGGLYNNFIGGEHGAELARRGCSKSFSLASIMAHNFVLGENILTTSRCMTILTAYTKEYLADKDGTISKFTPMIDFIAQHTQWPRRRLKDSRNELTWIMGYKDLDTGISKGTQNSVIGVATKDDTEKLRGKRGYILFEEFGTYKGLLDVYNIARHSVEEGDATFGLLYLVGTSGDDANDFYGAQELLYSPEGHKIYSIPNVYDKANAGKPRFPYFFPAYLNRLGFYNKDGVSDVVGALVSILKYRYKEKYKTNDPNNIIKAIAELPCTPAEAILKTSYSMFPVADIGERLLQLEAAGETDDVYTGDLIIDASGKIEYRPCRKEPIRTFPHKNNKNMEGAFEIFELPKKDGTGKVPSNRYIAGIDPYDDDESETTSLGSIFILDLWTDNIVAEYTGRPRTAEEFYEMCRRLLLFYNARANYESNKKGIFSYFASTNCTYLLTDVLDFLKERGMQKDGYGNKAKGTNASASINDLGRQLYKSWLLKKITKVNQKEDGTEETITYNHLFDVRNKALLLETKDWNSVGNFDRVSAMGMLMLLREDKMILYQRDIGNGERKVQRNPNLMMIF